MTPSSHERKIGPDEEGMRLERWLRMHFPSLGRAHIHKMLRTGQIRLNGRRTRPDARLVAGETARFPFPAECLDGKTTGTRPQGCAQQGAPGRTQRRMQHRTERLSGSGAPENARRRLDRMCLYEDDAVMVLNKPYGIAVQGGSGLTQHIDGMLAALAGPDGVRPRLVHRLDRHTSGVLLVAKTRRAARFFAEQLRARRVCKIYWALLGGVPKPAQGRISGYLARAPSGEHMIATSGPGADTRRAVSLYQVNETSANKMAFVTLRPITGRTHQLRVHMAGKGAPIVGDSKYAPGEAPPLARGLQNRLHLHARRLMIAHPGGDMLDIAAPLCDHMRQSWAVLGLSADDGDVLADPLVVRG